MSAALPGEHYCAKHQGNSSHYAPCNCRVCHLENVLRLWVNWRNGPEGPEVLFGEAAKAYAATVKALKGDEAVTQQE